MIFVSSYFRKESRISNLVREIALHGLRNIELTGGTEPYPKMIDDLIEMKKRYNLKYRLHNYFPPPEDHFVFNLASLDNAISQKSVEHAKRAIDLSIKLDSFKIGFHAGFFIRINNDELGQDIPNRELYDEDEATQRFIDNLEKIQKFSGNEFKIYIENNVVSKKNRERFPDRSPSMLNTYEDYLKLSKLVDFNLLLDIAHLKVSCKSFGINYEEQYSSLVGKTDYIHISDNDSFSDDNLPLVKNSKLIEMIKKSKYDGFDFTLEIFGALKKVIKSHNLLELAITENT